MRLFVYPAIFIKEEEGVTVVFPDLDIFTNGDNIENAYLLAKDLLGVYLTYAHKFDIDFPLPSTFEKISEVKYSKEQRVMLIDTMLDVDKLKKD